MQSRDEYDVWRRSSRDKLALCDAYQEEKMNNVLDASNRNLRQIFYIHSFFSTFSHL
jgi:hypothetical protein